MPTVAVLVTTPGGAVLPAARAPRCGSSPGGYHPLPGASSIDAVSPQPRFTAKNARRALARIGKWLLLLIVLWLVGRSLWNNLRRVDFASVRVAPLPLLGAVLAILSIYLMQLLSYRFLLGSYARRLPWRVMMAVAWVPLLGKYVPGKVAAIAAAVFLLRRFGVAAGVALSVVLVLDGLAVLAGLIVGARLLLMPGVAAHVPGGLTVYLAVVVVGLICVHPRVYARLVDLALKLLGRPPLPHRPTLRDYALPALTAILQWVFSGTGLWLMSRSLTAVPLADWPMFVSVAALAMTVSYLALFAPGGIGVREGIFMLGLQPLLGGQHAAIVVVAMRVVHIVIELALSGIGGLCLRSVACVPNAAESLSSSAP